MFRASQFNRMVEDLLATDIRALPDEILLEIFKWIPFNHLHRNLKPVCLTWFKLVSTHFRYPRTLLIRGTDRLPRIEHQVTAYSQRIVSLKLLDAFPSVITCLKEQQWPNLRTLVVRSTWPYFDRAPINVADLNRIIDSSPKLRFLKICDSLIDGDLQSLVEKLERRGITKFALLNRYFMTDNIERLYDLKRMKVFRVHCHSFTRDSVPATLDKFLANNQRTLTDLGLYMDTDAEYPGGDDALLRNIASSCSHLTKLALAGQLKVSAQGLAHVVDGLPHLRKLRIDVCSTLSSRSLAPFLRDERSRRLQSLKVAWYRRATSNELESLRQCCQHLTKLSLELWVDDEEGFVPDVVAALKNVRTSRLRELKLLFFDIGSLSALASLTSSARVKFVLELAGPGQEGRKAVEAYAKSIESPNFKYAYAYSFGPTRFAITRDEADKKEGTESRPIDLW